MVAIWLDLKRHRGSSIERAKVTQPQNDRSISDRDATLTDAVVAMALNSAWGRPRRCQRYSAGVGRRVCRRVSGSLPVGSDNDGAAVRHHFGAGRRVATDGKPRATPSRYGAAPQAAGRRRLLHLQGRHLRLCSLSASRRGCRCVGHLYRGASALCAGTLGPPAARRDRETGGAARLIDADAFGSDARRYRPRRAPLLCRRWPSPARAAHPADPEIAAEYWIIVHRDLRRSPCVRAVIDWVKALFAELRDVLAGAA